MNKKSSESIHRKEFSVILKTHHGLLKQQFELCQKLVKLESRNINSGTLLNDAGQLPYLTPEIFDELFIQGRSILTASTKHIAKPQQPAPPKFAECLVIFCAKSSRDALIGDLNERYSREYVEYGPERARRRYWAEAARSLGPLLWRALCRATKLAVVIDACRRILG